jgi:hypothetical protein
VLAGAMVAAAGVCLWHISAVLADDAVVIDGQDAANLDNYGGGMRRSNPRVKPFIEAHPDQLVVLCVAGCSGKPRIVQLLARPISTRTAEYQPSAAGPTGNGKGARNRFAEYEGDDVVCLAGCSGRPGQVVQRNFDLPPPPVVPKPPQEETSEAAPPAPPEKSPEPLDVHP